MSKGNLSDAEKIKISNMQGVGPMEPETLAEIIQNKTEFSDQGVRFAFKQHIEGPFTVESIEDALELLEQYRPLVAKAIARRQLAEQLKGKK